MVFFRIVSLLSKLRSHVTQQSSSLKNSVRWFQVQASSDLDLHSQLKELIPEQRIDLEEAKAQEIAKLLQS